MMKIGKNGKSKFGGMEGEWQVLTVLVELAYYPVLSIVDRILDRNLVRWHDTLKSMIFQLAYVGHLEWGKFRDVVPFRRAHSLKENREFWSK